MCTKTLRLSKELVEQFTGAETLDPLLYHLRRIHKVVGKDVEARAYFEDLGDYVIGCALVS